MKKRESALKAGLRSKYNNKIKIRRKSNRSKIKGRKTKNKFRRKKKEASTTINKLQELNAGIHKQSRMRYALSVIFLYCVGV